MSKIELLSPAGDFECLKSAVQAGADCVYFGGNMFNARQSAGNFNDEELKTAIEYAKIRNVKTNLALNILIKNDEFDDAIHLAKKAYEYGIDAIIVQDLGLAKKLISEFPDLPIHASTQMTVHNLEGVLEAEKLGFKRVVLSRELSLNEIKYICKNSNIEIEVFIHGALCICYSGQCLLSSMIGARSGNRGKCAQPCRLPYELTSCGSSCSSSWGSSWVSSCNPSSNLSCNSNSENIADDNTNCKSLDKGYLLSPKDLCSLELLPELIKLGITSFKIEGRLKTPEYVSTVTRIYRKYIDLAESNNPYVIDEKDKQDLLQVFNRGGFSTGYLSNEPNKNLISKLKPNNMGIFLGTVHNFNSNKGYVTLKLESPLSIGDSVSVEKEKNLYNISELMIQNKNLQTADAGDIVKIGRIKGKISVGDKIYKINSKELNVFANSLTNSENRKAKFNCRISIHENMPIAMCISSAEENALYSNINFEIKSDLIPVVATNTPITAQRIKEQVNKLGNLPFEFANIDVDLDDNLYVPSISKLNQLRRDALSKLEEILLDRIHRTHKTHNDITNDIAEEMPISRASSLKEKTGVSILLNIINPNNDYTKLNSIDRIYIPLRYFYNSIYEKTLKDLTENYNAYIYMPSVLKNTSAVSESELNAILKNYKIKGFVLSNLSNFEILKSYKNDYEFLANYTLNIYNNSTVSELQKLGVKSVTISPELDKASINEITSASPIEVIVYGNIPVMTTNYCLLSKSNNCLQVCKSNCSNSDEKFYLNDRLNFKFRIMPDAFSRTTTIFNSKKISYSPLEFSTDFIRFDFMDETIDEINDITRTFTEGAILEGKDYTNGNYNRLV